MTDAPFGPERRIVVGISGASGIVYGVRLLELLRAAGVQTHLVMSKSAEVTAAHELDLKLRDIRALATQCHSNQDVGASIASGSFRTMGMIVAPCSVRSMSEIASGVTSGLLTRAADVVLKERRRLVLLVRETPLHLGHLRMLTQLAEMGGIIFPPLPAFYQRPGTIAELVNHTVGRILERFGLPCPGLVPEWSGTRPGRGGAAEDDE